MTTLLNCSLLPLLPFAEAHQAAADADQVAGVQQPRAVHLLVVDPGSARRALVAQNEVVALVLDPGVNLVHARVAEQPQVTAFRPANGRFRPRQQQLPAGPETGLDLEPGFLQDHLRQADEQADAHAQGHEAGGRGAPQIIRAKRAFPRPSPSAGTARRPGCRPASRPGRR